MYEPVRLSKCVVALTGCSRREAELYIEGGWVTVNGAVVEAPQFAISDQSVALLPGARADAIEPVTLLLHKPAGIDSDEGDQPAWKLLDAQTREVAPTEPARTVLRRHFAQLRVPLPLAATASGLLVMSQDYRVIRRLTEDARRIEQEFVVEVDRDIDDETLAQLDRAGQGGAPRRPPCKLSGQSERRLRLVASDIRAVQIDELCAAAGLAAREIRRIRIGRVAMAKLPVGRWRYLAANALF